MRKIVFIIIVAAVSFAAGFGAGNYKILDYKVVNFSNENTCPYLRNHQSADSENECPYLENKESELGECPYLRNKEAESYNECPYLRGETTKPAGKEKIKTMPMKAS